MELFYGISIPFLGTVLGAACVFFMKKSLGDLVQRALTGFASGVMVAASIWSLLIPAMEQSSQMGKLAFVPAVVGFWIGILFLLLLDRVIPHLHRNSEQAEGPKSQLQRTTMMLLAVTLHNIPEGMAISVPLISGGMSKMKAVFLTALSGFPTVLGAFIGYAIGDVGPIGLSLSLSFASGAMLYVVYGEIIPQALLMHRSKAPAFAIIMGLIVGLLIIYI